MKESSILVIPPILVTSCDKYSDVWKPFFHVFRKRWFDCPFPIYLGTNHFRCEEPGVTTINVGDDRDWASGVIRMLEQIDTSHVILFLEDFLLVEPVDSAAILRLVTIAQTHSLACLRLAPLPPPTPLPVRLVSGFSDIGIVEKGSPYRVATQPAIWRKDFLLKLLVPGLSAWEFEHLGTTMSEFMEEQIWGPIVPYIVYEQGVEKGKWKPSALSVCIGAGASVDLSVRPVFSEDELQQHYTVGAAAAKFNEIKMDAIRSYLLGRRAEGTKLIARYLVQQPSSLQAWAIFITGLIGPLALQWIRKVHMEIKIGKIRRLASAS